LASGQLYGAVLDGYSADRQVRLLLVELSLGHDTRFPHTSASGKDARPDAVRCLPAVASKSTAGARIITPPIGTWITEGNPAAAS
jgi:hypothetical protein